MILKVEFSQILFVLLIFMDIGGGWYESFFAGGNGVKLLYIGT